MPTVEYEDLLSEQLKDLDYTAGYLTACLEEGEDVFILGLKDVAKATKLDGGNISDLLSQPEQPLFVSVATVLDNLGLKFSLKPKIPDKT